MNKTKTEDRPFEEPLPSTRAPNEWAAAALLLSACAHVLFYLICHWKVNFCASVRYRHAESVGNGCWFQVTPHAHRGKAALVPGWRAELSGRLCVEFQKQRYEFWGPEDEPDDYDPDVKPLDGGEIEGPGELRLVECPIDKPLSEYLAARGLGEVEVEDLRAQFGHNNMDIPAPSFWACYKEQLVSPLVIFQIFVALLWAMDDFLQYTLMQIGMVLIFESTTVFQRIKTRKTLNSMGTKPYDVKVYRSKEWLTVCITELLPGDLLQLALQAAEPSAASGAATTPETEAASNDIVPCDCVLIRGDAVTNEAAITGESVPQMKDALPSEGRPLDIDNADRCHSLFSGSRVLRASSGAVITGDTSGLPTTPDGGALAYVLRTGFYSSQGELLQVIEFSQQKVSGDSKEIMIALLILTCFALCAAGYVLKKGLDEGEKTPHELLIKCVIILTAVVPRQLPMQMSLAVNTALMGLFRSGVFCTEPFRVPYAGKITHCLFDKTGTLTTDTLVPAGVVNKACPEVLDNTLPWRMVAFQDAAPEAAVVLAGCHALVSDGPGASKNAADGTEKPGNYLLDNTVLRDGGRGMTYRATMSLEDTAKGDNGAREIADWGSTVVGILRNAEAEQWLEVADKFLPVRVDGKVVITAKPIVEKLVGDPVEVAGLKGVHWRYSAEEGIARPGDWAELKMHDETVKADVLKMKAAEKEGTVPKGLLQTPEAAMKMAQEKRALAEMSSKAATEALNAEKARAEDCPTASVQIVHRFHFASKLQRMSVVAKLTAREGSIGGPSTGHYLLVKGSPEALGTLLASGSAPEWFESSYRDMAEKGRRVLALASRKLPDSVIGADGKCTIGREEAERDLDFVGFVAFECQLRSDSHLVMGSLFDSGHSVAMVTGDAPLTALHVARACAIASPNKPALVLKVEKDGSAAWSIATGENRGQPPSRGANDAALSLLQLSERYTLMATEDALEVAAEARPELWDEVGCIQVLARMTPNGKAKVIRALQKIGAFVLMCGDGGNDVGALKQADAGLALLSGHGEVNTSDGGTTSPVENDAEKKTRGGAGCCGQSSEGGRSPQSGYTGASHSPERVG